MGWPQIIWIALAGVTLGIHLVKHGEPRTDKYSIVHALIDTGITAVILYYGGFFK